MLVTELLAHDFGDEFEFQYSRSSGPGGQNVNKVESKVELRFDIQASGTLTETQKIKLKTVLASQLTNDGILIIVAQESRSQLQNKQIVVKKFKKILEQALKEVKARKAPKISMAAMATRLKNKKINAEKKANRKISFEEE